MPVGKVQLLKIFLITWGSVAVTAAFMVIGTRNFTVIGPENEQLLLIWKPQCYLYSVPFGVCVLHRVLNVVAASQSSVAEDIGKYAAKEAISMSGEEREILTALEAFTRIQE